MWRGDHVQTVKQIFAETALFDGLLQVPVGGGNDADMGLPLLGLPNAFVFLFLKETEELGLNLDGQLANFIQEERAALGQSDFAPGLGGSAGEGPFDVAEELALEQLA